VIKSIDRELITRAVHSFADELRRNYPEIICIVWFGSWLHGHPSPGSDVDLCLILSHTDLPPRDRASHYLPVGFPVGLDLLVYTTQEFDRLGRESPGMKREILRGTDL